MTYSNNSEYLEYDGNWRENFKDGNGTLLYRNRTMDVGSLLRWNLSLAIGEKYCGSFVNDSFEGNGTYTYFDGSFYRGEWSHNKYHGNGMLRNRSKYEVQFGQFSNGEHNGLVLTYITSWSHEGYYKDGLRDGIEIYNSRYNYSE